MSVEQASSSTAALGALLHESVHYWGLNWRVEVTATNAIQPAEMPSIYLYDLTAGDVLAGLTVEALTEPGLMRWRIITSQPDPVTLRTEHYCASVLHVLRTVRQLLVPTFRPGDRFRMGVASLAV
jgi:hypothetical protein